MEKHSLICFAFMPWNSMWKRNQSMIAELSKSSFVDKVVFVNPDISFPQMLKQRGNPDFRLGQQFLARHVAPGIQQYTPFHVLPTRLQRPLFARTESRFHLMRIRRLIGSTPYIVLMNCPNLQYPYPLDHLLLESVMSLFDLSDDFIELVHSVEGKSRYAGNIERYVRRADAVLAVNDHLRLKYTGLNPNIHVVANATNFANFDRETYAEVPFLERIKRGGAPIIGYSGICNLTRIDIDLLRYLLTNRPRWQFVFVGSKGEELLAELSGYENLHHHPAVDYRQLPDYIAYFDVAIVPFQDNDHTRGNNLLKFHDYLAMGKPVVTTNVGGAEHLNTVLHTADNPDSFLKAIEDSLTEHSAEATERRKHVAEANAWPNRIKEVEALILRHLARKDGATLRQASTTSNVEQA